MNTVSRHESSMNTASQLKNSMNILAFILKCKDATLFLKFFLGLSIYYMKNRSTIIRYFIKVDEESHQNGLKINFIS